MPGWSPPHDVRFDHAAAAAVRTTADHARRRLDASIDSEGALAGPAFSTWSGETADEARRWFDSHQAALVSASSLLLDLAEELWAAAQAAAVEQAHRDRIRADWFRELHEGGAAAPAEFR